MMTLNNNEKDFQEKLQKDTEMPAIVHERINQAYRLIENNAVLQKKAPKDPYHWMKIGGRVAGGMAAVLAVGFIFCATNPVMAKNIPVVAIVGENEMNEGKAMLKNMETGEQNLVSAEELIATVKK